MNNGTAGLESTVAELRQAVLSLQQRVEVLEATVASSSSAPRAREEGAPQAAATKAARRDPYDPIAILTLVGRLFLVLAGGFFLRAMTESGVLVPPLGLSVGFGYAMVWLYFADRAGGRAEVPGAVFHALGAALIAYPLLVEAATKFKVLGGTSSAMAVTLLTAAMLFVAAHRRLRAVGWITVLGALPTSAVLLSQTGVIAPFALFLIVFGVATLWFGYTLDWWGMRWPAALAADVVVIGVTLRVLAPEQPDAPLVALLLQLSLLGGYVVSIAIRTLVRGRNVVPFEVAQTAAALVVGFGGALYLTRVTGILPAAIGGLSIAAGAASYGVAVVFLDRRKDNGRNVYYYTTLGLVHVVAGCALILGSDVLGVACALLAVVAAGLWARFGRSFMLVHSAAYLLVAGLVSGTLLYGALALAGASAGPWVMPGVAVLAVLVAAVLAAMLTSARRNPAGERIASGLRLVIAMVLLAAAASCVIGYVAPVFGGSTDGGVAPGVLATVTTVVLALATLFAAWIGTKPRFREWSWLVYPLLVGIGLKMVMQDFKVSRPATLFIAMALYGAALIVAPRLRRSIAGD